MGKFKTVNELVNSLQPDYPVYCIRLNEIKKSVKFFKDNFPGKILYAVKTNPNEKIIKQIIANGVNEFEFELPATKRKLTFKLLTSGDEKTIDEEVKGYEKIHGIGYELTTRLKHQIISVDGDTKRASINSFVDNEFLSRDSMAFRKYVSDIMPDVNMTSTYTDEDGNEKEFTVPMTVTFLWPNAGI